MKIAIFSQDINQDVENVLQSILVHEEASNCNFFIHDNLKLSISGYKKLLYGYLLI